MSQSRRRQARRTGFSRNIGLIGALALTLAAAGCGAKTNFSFPSFGLIGKNDEASRDRDPNAGQSQRLIDSPSR